MKKIYLNISILLGTILFCLLSCSAKEPSLPDSVINEGLNALGAEIALKKYLDARSMGRYDICAKFLTEPFKNVFAQTHGTDYIDYFRNQSEDYFRNPQILETIRQADGTLVIKTSIEVQGPSYVSRAHELYFMILEEGIWKINDWKIEYR